MKKIIIYLFMPVLLSSYANAQDNISSVKQRDYKIFTFGPKISFGTSLISQEDKSPFGNNVKMGVTYSAGLLAEVRPIKLIGIEVNALYSPFRFGLMPFARAVDDNDGSVRSVIVRYINTPVILNFYIGEDRLFSCVSIGYQPGHRMSAKVKKDAAYNLNGKLNTSDSEAKELFTDVYNSLLLGLGGKLSEHVTLGAMVNLGLDNMINTDRYGYPDKSGFGKVKANSIHLVTSYRF